MKSIETGVWGAYQNVIINLNELKEDDVRQKVRFTFPFAWKRDISLPAALELLNPRLT